MTQVKATSTTPYVVWHDPHTPLKNKFVVGREIAPGRLQVHSRWLDKEGADRFARDLNLQESR
jgi:hypothetical protein